MASNIVDLESQLLALTRRRVEIDSRWITISEQLLAARSNSSEAQDEEVPPVLEQSKSNSNLPTTQTANISTHTPDTQEGVSSNTEAVPDVEVPQAVAQTEIEVSADAAIPEDVASSTRSVHSEVPKEESVSNTSVNIEKVSEVPVNEPDTATSPKVDLPAGTSHQEENQQEHVHHGERQIPPPPSAILTSNSQRSTTEHIPENGMFPDPAITQRSEQYLQQPATGIELGNKQLLRTQRSCLHYPQPSMNMQDPYPRTDTLHNMMGPHEMMTQHMYQPESLQSNNLLPQPSLQMDPRNHLEWQSWQHSQQQSVLSSPQVKAERMQGSPYIGHRSITMPQRWTTHQPFYNPQFEYLPPSQPQTFSPRPHTAQSLSRRSQHQNQVDNVRQGAIPSRKSVPPEFESEPRYIGVPQRRQRSPSLQITDVRPAQRPRLGDRPFGADATPDSQRIKIEDNTGSAGNESGRPGRFDCAQAPLPRTIRPFEDDVLHDDPPPSRRRTDINRRTWKVSSAAERTASRGEHDRPQQRRRSPVSASHRAKSRRNINEDYDDEEEEEDEEKDVDDEFDVVNIQPQRGNLREEDFADLAEYDDDESPLTAGLAMRTTFGAPKPVQRTPLTLEQKHTLELRYCARVAMVIGSKRCVMAPVEQISKTRNIFTIMRQKFGHIEEDEESLRSTIKPYRNATDFVIDARGMLQCYVALGHCTPCPFRNPRVMCWRMRLESVLDQRMRGLKTCLKNCAENFDSDDMEGMMDYVDSWFNAEELQEDVDLY